MKVTYSLQKGKQRETKCQETSVSELTKKEGQETSVSELTKREDNFWSGQSRITDEVGEFISAWILMPYPPHPS